MADIRKRTGKNGTTEQGGELGLRLQKFSNAERGSPWEKAELLKLREPGRLGIFLGIDEWLDICRHEGRRGKKPVSKATMKGYEYRAEIMKAYIRQKELHNIEAPDVVAFCSWLLRTHTRDLARKFFRRFIR